MGWGGGAKLGVWKAWQSRGGGRGGRDMLPYKTFEIWNVGDAILRVFMVYFRQCKCEPEKRGFNQTHQTPSPDPPQRCETSFVLTWLFVCPADVITIDRTGENFRMLYDVKGRFTVHRITADEAKVCCIKQQLWGTVEHME